MRELTRNLKAMEDVVSVQSVQIENLSREKMQLQFEVEDLRRTLVLKENTFSIHTNERDALLRELSQQLYDARNAIYILERRAGVAKKTNRNLSPHSKKAVRYGLFYICAMITAYEPGFRTSSH